MHRYLFCFTVQFDIKSLFKSYFLFFFFNDTATTEIYTLSLHDALPIWIVSNSWPSSRVIVLYRLHSSSCGPSMSTTRSEEHTSELQSRRDLVCRLLLEKKKLISFERYSTLFWCDYYQFSTILNKQTLIT